MTLISDITVPAPEVKDPVRTWLGDPDPDIIAGSDLVAAWLSAAAKAGLKCSLTDLATTSDELEARQKIVLHKDIVLHKRGLYKVVVNDGVVRAKPVPAGSVLPNSIQLQARTKPGQDEAAALEWLNAAKKSSCDVLRLGPATIMINGVATVMHRPTGRQYEVVQAADGAKGTILFAVRKV